MAKAQKMVRVEVELDDSNFEELVRKLVREEMNFTFYQYRFPRSKKRRIREKWQKRWENYRVKAGDP